MKQGILADTSVWINFFKGNESPQVKKLVRYIEDDAAVFLCPTIIQEILQGITSDKECEEIKTYLLAFPILKDAALEMAIDAARIYRSLRKMGVTIRKSNDCLIAQYAIKHSLVALHQDRNFDLIMDNKK